MLTIEWQELTPAHGYTMPRSVADAGGARTYAAAMDRSAALYADLDRTLRRTQAAYAVALAYRIRYVMQCNAREAMHLIELRPARRATRSTARCASRCTGSSPTRPATGSSRP